jgi:hypothetical protein
MSNKNSAFFDDEDIIESSDYNLAVDPQVFLDKIAELCVYEQDYTYKEVVDLKQAEQILMFVRNLCRE